MNYESARLSQSPKTEPYANKWMVLMVVSVGIFISCMDGSMVNIATPSIAVTMGNPSPDCSMGSYCLFIMHYSDPTLIWPHR
ncbi:MAG: hypothetical protein ACOX5W_05845 [Bacillota bacterium]